MVRKERSEPKPGGLYRHYHNGREYRVRLVVPIHESEIKVVVYAPNYGPTQTRRLVYGRFLDEFMEKFKEVK